MATTRYSLGQLRRQNPGISEKELKDKYINQNRSQSTVGIIQNTPTPAPSPAIYQQSVPNPNVRLTLGQIRERNPSFTDQQIKDYSIKQSQMNTGAGRVSIPISGAVKQVFSPGSNTNMNTPFTSTVPNTADSPKPPSIPSPNTPTPLPGATAADIPFYRKTEREQRLEMLEKLGATDEAKKIAGMTDLEYAKYLTSREYEDFNKSKELSSMEQKIRDAQLKEASFQNQRAIAGAKSAYNQGPEGVQTSTAQGAAAGFEKTSNQRMQNAIQQDYIARSQLETIQRQQQEALARGEVDRANGLALDLAQAQRNAAIEQQNLINAQETAKSQSLDIVSKLQNAGILTGMDQGQIQELQNMFPDLPENLLGLFAKSADRAYQAELDRQMSEDQQVKVKNQQSALGLYTGLMEKGMQFDNQGLMQIAQETGLPLETLMNFNSVAEQVMGDKSLDSATKQAKLAELSMQLDRQQRGILNADLEKVDYITNLYRQGASQEEIALAKRVIGVKDEDDPMYVAQLQRERLQNQAISIANRYLPQEKIAEIQGILLKNQNQSIQNQYLPQEKEGSILEQSIKNEYLPQEKQLAIQNQFYDNIIKEAQANHAPDTEIQKLKQLKAEAALKTAEMNEKLGIYPVANVPTKSVYTPTLNPDGSLSFDVSGVKESVQCGRFVNNVVGIHGYVGDTLASKLARTEEGRTPQVGDLFVTRQGVEFTDKNGKVQNSGHTGIVTKVNDDGTVNVTEANWSAPGKIGNRYNVKIDGMAFGPNPNSKQEGGSNSKEKSSLLKIPEDARTAVTQKANQFDGEQAVKNFQQVQSGYYYAKNIDNNSTNPADDIGLIYAFAKVMDPNSVVREGEYNTIQKYAQTWADTFGFQANRIFSNTNFLTPEARENMKTTLQSKYNSEKEGYDNIRKQYIRSINSIAGREVGENLLQDYSYSMENPDVELYKNASIQQEQDEVWNSF